MRAPPLLIQSARAAPSLIFLNSNKLSQLIHILPVYYIKQILSVLVLLHYFIGLEHIFFADPAVQIGDFFQASDLSVLVLLHGLHEDCCVYKALVGSRVKPCEALAEEFYVQLVLFQIDPVQVGNLIFAAG